jgi:hypothetical protein
VQVFGRVKDIHEYEMENGFAKAFLDFGWIAVAREICAKLNLL